MKYLSPPSSSTKLDKIKLKRADNFIIQISTRAHQARVPSWINKIEETCTALFNFIHPAWYSCRSLQFYLSSLVLELGGLGYFVKYPSSPNSGTKLDEFHKRLYTGSFQFDFTQIGTRAWWARVPICQMRG